MSDQDAWRNEQAAVREAMKQLDAVAAETLVTVQEVRKKLDRLIRMRRRSHKTSTCR